MYVLVCERGEVGIECAYTNGHILGALDFLKTIIIYYHALVSQCCSQCISHRSIQFLLNQLNRTTAGPAHMMVEYEKPCRHQICAL